MLLVRCLVGNEALDDTKHQRVAQPLIEKSFVIW